MQILGRIYNLISGEGTVASQQASFDAQSNFMQSVLGQASAQVECNEEDPTCKDRWHVWAQGDASRSTRKGDMNVSSTKSSSMSMTLGADYRPQTGVVLGAALAGLAPRYQNPDREASGNSDGASVAAYGLVQSQIGTYAKAVLSAAFMNNWESRMAFMTPVKGSYQSHMMSGRLELGQHISISSVTFTPFAGAQMTRLVQNDYAENDLT